MTNKPLATIGYVAKQNGASIHQVRYVIESLGIEPAGRAGLARVFSNADVKRITQELRRIATQKRELQHA